MFLFFFFVLAIILFGVLIITAYVSYLIRHSSGKKNGLSREKVSLCTVLGSGGHTKEMLEILKELNPKFSPRIYIIADTDTMSEDKVFTFERNRQDYTIHKIPRAREVGQSYTLSIKTTIIALISSAKLVFQANPDLLLLNGPGTCIPVAFLAAFYDMIRLRDTVIIYQESICRVKKLSLTGSILYYTGLADDVVVQWEQLKEKYPRVQYIEKLHVRGKKTN